MDDTTKSTLTNLDSWKRGFFMLVFSIISGLTKLLVTLVAIFQFITLLFKGKVNQEVLPFGQNLSSYLYQISLFLTFKTEEMPFPFMPFPDGAPESGISSIHDSEEGKISKAETTTINDDGSLDTTN